MSACRQSTASCIVIGCKTSRRELTGWCDVGSPTTHHPCDVGSPTSHHPPPPPSLTIITPRQQQETVWFFCFGRPAQYAKCRNQMETVPRGRPAQNAQCRQLRLSKRLRTASPGRLMRERHQPLSRRIARPRLPRCGTTLIWTPFPCCLAARKINGRNDSAHQFDGYVRW